MTAFTRDPGAPDGSARFDVVWKPLMAIPVAPVQEDSALSAEQDAAQSEAADAPGRRSWWRSRSDASLRSWPLYVLAAPATVAVWSGWVGLGEMTGFGMVHPLPGIADKFSINTAITLPVGVEAYAAYALGAWLTRKTLSDGTRKFARVSAIGALILGACGQVAYHLLTMAPPRYDKLGHLIPPSAPWQITTLVACLPVVVLFMGATLAHLIHRDARTETEPEQAQATSAPMAPDRPTAVVQPTAEPTLVPMAPDHPERMVRTAGAAVVRTTEEPPAETTVEATSAPMVQTTAEDHLETTAKRNRKTTTKGGSKGGSKPRRRTRDQLRKEVEREVSEIAADGGEIQVKPIADKLRANRTTVRELLDEMNIRPIHREATG